MKIKEVIEKTGLTDRAIRLYINEGLAAPSIEESYSGRKSIEFSEEDVKRLNNVAMLRKAGFSIADIKSIVDNKEIAKEIIGNFIVQTENNIEHEKEIVKKLKEISFDEEVTIETICKSLSATVEKTEVPSEDMKLTLREKIKKFAVIAFACFQIALAVSILVIICIDIFDFRYKKFDASEIGGLLFHASWLFIIALSAIIIRMNTGRRFFKNSRGALKGSTAGLVASVIVFEIFVTPISILFAFIGAYPFYSQTTNPDNYLKLDSGLEIYLENDAVLDVFPRRIPDSAHVEPWRREYLDTTKYFYEFVNCSDGYFGTYDICAEWVLPLDEYEKAKSELPGDLILEQNSSLIEEVSNSVSNEYRGEIETDTGQWAVDNSSNEIVERGNWTFVYYEKRVSFESSEGEKIDAELKYEETENELEITDWNDVSHYTVLLCAYNDKQQKIRYIASECCGHETRENGPYYISLDWN